MSSPSCYCRLIINSWSLKHSPYWQQDAALHAARISAQHIRFPLCWSFQPSLNWLWVWGNVKRNAFSIVASITRRIACRTFIIGTAAMQQKHCLYFHVDYRDSLGSINLKVDRIIFVSRYFLNTYYALYAVQYTRLFFYLFSVLLYWVLRSSNITLRVNILIDRFKDSPHTLIRA